MNYVRECLLKNCKKLGGDGCPLNPDSIVDCFYVRGDEVDVKKWESKEDTEICERHRQGD